jgi:hypothetical protein
MHWPWRNEYIRIVGRGKLLGLSDNFSIHEWAAQHLVESGYDSWLYWCCTSLLNPLDPATRAATQNGKKTFSNSNVKDSLKFQTRSIIGAIEDDILLDGRTWWIPKGTVRSWWHGSKVDRHHVGYLLKINDTRALIGQMVDVYETDMTWLDDECKPRGTLGWEWTIGKSYLGKSNRDLIQTRKDFQSSVLAKS